MSAQPVNFTTPVGRLVQGSLYKAQTTDAENRPLVIKNGPNAGQPRVDYYFALAIPKGPEGHWANTEWGAKIWALGHSAFPKIAESPSFAWKITDGDSQVANLKGKKPCDATGFKGHWVLHFSGGFAPKIYNKDGSALIVEPDAVKIGYYAQVNCNVTSNNSQQKPGIYLNHTMVAMSGYGDEITFGPDVAAAGFGNAPLPAGAMATPPAGLTPPASGAPAVPGAPVSSTPGLPPIAPNPAILAVPPAAPPAAPAGRQMTAKAAGHTYEAMKAANWTDDMLIQNGYMTA